MPAVNESDVAEVLELDKTIAMLALAVGVALLLGNGLAIVQHLRGRKPEGEEGEFRTARAIWLLAVGLLITVWSLLSL